MKFDLYQIDAFSSGPFTGNPAAVILLQDWLNAELMQQIAAENNLSETAFIVPGKDVAHWGLRWFTPATEVPLCGHATFASGVVIMRHICLQLDKVNFSSKSGVLSVERDGNNFVVDLPATPETTWIPPTDLSKGLETKIIASGGDDFPFVIISDATHVSGLSVETGVQLANENQSGELIVSAPGENGIDFVIRVFAPGVGIDEDPVTGSAFAAITPYWAKRLGKTHMKAFQASKRGGHVSVELQQNRVRLGGGAHEFLQGSISL